ncbi:MAG TPA: uroporphyrinogen-III synthase [Candidatus Tectomicrobia bacterium]|nr:uroporphyrinogen-III synthase [Candidatus Tectomicrobia bacterium]
MTLSTGQQPLGLSKPLRGKKILITRARQQASRFAALLREYGAEPIEVPTIQIVPPSSWEPLDRAIAAIHTYDWLIFTSVHGVQAFLARFDAQGRQLPDLQGLHVCAIGPATANALRQGGIDVDVMPSEYRAEAVVDSLAAFPMAGSRILVPRAAIARDVLPRTLEARGAHVDVVEAYRTVLPTSGIEPERWRLLEEGAIDVVTFTSSSTVTNFALLIGDMDLAQLLRQAVVACIGPITAATARAHGLTPTIVSVEYTVPALAQAIVKYFESLSE